MAAPRWQKAIQTALSAHESVVIQLASIDPGSRVPHVRSHIFRKFINALPNNPLVLTTTDMRSPKCSQIIAHPHVELVWWIEGSQEQFRISGLTSVIPHPEHALYKHFMHSTRPGQGGPAFAALEQQGFDWEQNRRDVFDSMSPYMKASWCRPVPGSRLEGGQEEIKSWPEQVAKPADTEPTDSAEWKNWKMAFSNFGLLVIDPIEVDYVQLGVFPNQRTRFWKDAENQWQEEAIVP